MPIRNVTASGVEWTIWNVVPTSAARLETTGVEAVYRSGWLTFDSGAEKRRLAPFPGEWDTLADDELILLIAQAQLVPVRRKAGTPPMPPALP